MSKVTVCADKDGNVIGVSENNPEYGYVRVEQTIQEINDQGWLRIAKRSALIKGKVEDLQQMNFADGQELEGKIVVKESLTPFNTDEPDRDLKIAGDTGVICRQDDQPIYRQANYTTNPDAFDVFVTHTNGQEIKDVQQAQKAMNALQAAGKARLEAQL
jgi:hypothetical protein